MRRRVIKGLAATVVGVAAMPPWMRAANPPEHRMRFGLVTYMWGADWDLPTLIAHCEASGVLGVELRTTHKHGVEPSLTPQQRSEVKRRFADSRITLVGIGSNEMFDSPDPAKLAASVESTKAFIRLSHDVGGSGVKVKPDSFHPDVPREKTIEQIGRTLNRLGPFAADHGQQLRLEVHGQCAELPTIKAILDIADHSAVAVCWNSNPQDLQGQGLEHNFGLVKDRMGRTLHAHQFDHPTIKYPYPQLIRLLKVAGYHGWVLLEASGPIPQDRVKALIEQRTHFEQMVAGT